MKGIQFVIDDKREKRRFLSTFQSWGEFWEDIYDVLVSKARRNEPTVSWEELKAEVRPASSRC